MRLSRFLVFRVRVVDVTSCFFLIDAENYFSVVVEFKK